MLKRVSIEIIKAIGVTVFWLLFWLIAAKQVGMELLLPSPERVFIRLGELVCQKDFFVFTGTSLLRIISGTFISAFAGVILAILTHLSPLLKTLFAPLLSVIRATPVASFILLALVWINKGILPIFISSLLVLPVVWSNVSEGLKQIDKKHLEMAKIFRLGISKTIINIYVPSVLPFFESAFRTSIGLAWKAGIAAEVLAVPARSIGKKLYESKTYFETTDLFAWTIVVIILSLIIEFLFERILSAASKRRGG